MEKHLVAVAFDDRKTSVSALTEALSKGDYPPEGAPRTLAAMPAATERTLVGKVTQESLLRDYPAFRDNYRSYTPRKDVVGKIAAVGGGHDILVFFGTWSKDSVSEVPKILRILDAADNRDLKCALYGVDRDGNEGIGMSEAFGIRRLPTTIVLRNGVETGRIAALPGASLEEILLGILQKE
jgi:hypothetical protein